jgi:predicted metalloendopeptidase
MAMHIDSTIKPGDDFFLFASGKWFKENPIPASKQNNGLWQMIQIASKVMQCGGPIACGLKSGNDCNS